jgi:hypothetical protein
VSGAPAFGQAMDFDQGCLSIVVDDTGGLVTTAGGATNISFTAAAQQFYTTHNDDYDFIMFFPDFAHSDGSFHQIVFNDITGLGTGRPALNNQAAYGSAGSLQSITNYVAYTGLPANPEARIPGNNDSTLSLIAQEVSHRWGGFARHAAGDNTLLGRSGSHWSYYVSVPGTGPRGGASSLEGNAWVDNGDGTFTTIANTDGFSELDQYLMGLRGTNAVSPFFFIQNPAGGLGRAFNQAPAPPDTVTGTRVNVSINDIVNANGARNPTSAAAPKLFRQAFVLLAQNVPSQANIDRLEGIRTDWEDYFSEETDFLGSVDTCINRRPVDIVFLVDVSGSFDDDLPVLQSNAPALVQAVLDVAPNSRFGLASFSDFPFDPYGSAADNDFAYRLDQALTTDTGAFQDAIDDLTTFNAVDLPQSQYEALFQVLTGEGRDLDGNGDFTDLGDIAPSDIGADPDNPLFIFMFTDAPFHDPDLEPDYPQPGAVTAGRQDVIDLLQNTPFVFGLLSGDDEEQIGELADLTGGQLFDLEIDSSGFGDAVLEAIDTTQPPPDLTRIAMLDDLTITRAEINWEIDDISGLALVRVDGEVVLPEDFDFESLAQTGGVTVHVADAPVVHRDVDYTRSDTSNVWHSTTTFDEGLHARIRWTSATTGIYRIQASFTPHDFAIDGESGPMALRLVVSLGDENLSRDVAVIETQWDRADAQHWRKRKQNPFACGLGAEFAILVVPLMWARRRVRRK